MVYLQGVSVLSIMNVMTTIIIGVDINVHDIFVIPSLVT